MLNNYTCIGKIYYKGEVFDGKQERIISDKLWERVQEILRSDAPVKDFKGKVETLMQLKGLLYCGHCGCKIGPTYAKKAVRCIPITFAPRTVSGQNPFAR